MEDTPGVTRDRIYGILDWLTLQYRLIDTGGIQIEDQPFSEEINMQVEIAIEEANVIVMIVSAKEGITSDDVAIARKLKKSNKPIILAVNKADNESLRMNIYEFYELGLGDPIPISGAHGLGLGDLMDIAVKDMPDQKIPDYEGITSFCVIGRQTLEKARL